MKWRDNLLKEFIDQLEKIPQQRSLLARMKSDHDVGIHLAVFTEPYLSAILQKKKLMESRFSLNRINPFRRVYEGDIVLIKRSAGNVVGFFLCGKVIYWVKNQKTKLEDLEQEYGEMICTSLDKNFWGSRAHSRFGTLVTVEDVFLLKEIQIDKQDRVVWAVLKERHKPSIFDEPKVEYE